MSYGENTKIGQGEKDKEKAQAENKKIGNLIFSDKKTSKKLEVEDVQEEQEEVDLEEEQPRKEIQEEDQSRSKR